MNLDCKPPCEYRFARLVAKLRKRIPSPGPVAGIYLSLALLGRKEKKEAKAHKRAFENKFSVLKRCIVL
jgi:hypothetical protein